MAVVEELLRQEEDGTISFGNYELSAKAKLEDFSHGGASFRVKTFREITKLEKNDLFAYESVPGTAVHHFSEEGGLSFIVEGEEDAEITLGLEANTSYKVFMDDKEEAEAVKTGLAGKVTLSLELEKGKSIRLRLVKEA